MQIHQGQPILTTAQMRSAEQSVIDKKIVSSDELMELAGQAVACASNKTKLDAGRVVIVVGCGNNGGDGFVAARLLRKRQVPVTVIPLFPLRTLKGDNANQAALAAKAGAKIRPATSSSDLNDLNAWLGRAVLIVDAIFGTGLKKTISGWLAQAINCINQANRPILAIDIASGLDGDNGSVLGTAIHADATLPIAAYKWGHWLNQGSEHSGCLLQPAPIGINLEALHHTLKNDPQPSSQSLLIDKTMIEKAFPKPAAHAHKQTFGHLWVFGGSVGFTGAPKLAAMGAQAVGIGLVSIVCPKDVYEIIASSSLETMVHPQGNTPSSTANAIVAGPGWGKKQADKLIELFSASCPIVLDADALNMLAEHSNVQTSFLQRRNLSVLTPHPGEAGRLLGISANLIQQDRLGSALALAKKYHAWVVLKGAQTIIVSPDRHIWINPFGSFHLAVAGTGDILAGMVGALLAAGEAPEIAIPAAVGLHGLSGEQKSWHRAGQLPDIIAAQRKSFM